MKFRVKRRWWMWAIGIVWNICAVRWFVLGAQVFAGVIFILELVVILPEIHRNYEITYRQFTVKRVFFADISFPCDRITSVENATVFTAWGGRSPVINMNQIVEWSMGTYKITYSANPDGDRRRKIVVVSPKNHKEFINELSRHVDPKVIWLNNKESAFKKKKDEM